MTASEQWAALLVTSAVRSTEPPGGLVVTGKFLGTEAFLKGEEVAAAIRDGSVHLCLEDPCTEELPLGSVLHVGKVRRWSLAEFDAEYLSREGKSIITKAKNKEAREAGAPPGTAGTPPAKRKVKDKAPARSTRRPPPKVKRKVPAERAIEVSSEGGGEEEDLELDEDNLDGEPMTGSSLRDVLRRTRERITSQREAFGELQRQRASYRRRLQEEDMVDEAVNGGRAPKRTRSAPVRLTAAASLHPGRATPLALMDQGATNVPVASGSMTRKVAKRDPSAMLLAQAVQSSTARKSSGERSGKSTTLVKALKKAIGKKDDRRKKIPQRSRRRRASLVKDDPDDPDDGDDDPFDDEESSSPQESESELSYEPPLRRKAARSPGSVMQMLVKHAQDQLDRGSLAEEPLRQEEALIGGVKISTYFALLIRPYFPAGNPLLRELYSLAQTIDYLRAGKLPEAADALAGRFVSVHTALSEGSWATAAHLEMHPLEPVSSTSTATMLQAQRHRRLVLKSQGINLSYQRNTWNPQGKGRGGYGSEKGGKGNYQGRGKGRGKNKGGKDSWNAKGENPWKNNKEDSPRKEG